MELKHFILGLVEAVLWYFFLYYLLFTIKRPERNVWIAAAVLLTLFYTGFVLCPWVRHTPAWQGQ